MCNQQHEQHTTKHRASLSCDCSNMLSLPITIDVLGASKKETGWQVSRRRHSSKEFNRECPLHVSYTHSSGDIPYHCRHLHDSEWHTGSLGQQEDSNTTILFYKSDGGKFGALREVWVVCLKVFSRVHVELRRTSTTCLGVRDSGKLQLQSLDFLFSRALFAPNGRENYNSNHSVIIFFPKSDPKKTIASSDFLFWESWLITLLEP